MRQHVNKLRQKSKCGRVKMGAVIIDIQTGEIIGEGVNNGSNEACLNDGITKDPIEHAEKCAINSITQETMDRTPDAEITVSHYPCIDCAKDIINVGFIQKVICKRPFKSSEGVDFLLRNNIEVSFDKMELEDIKLNDNYLIIEKFDTSKVGGITVDSFNMTPSSYCTVIKSENDEYKVGDVIIVNMASTQYLTINPDLMVLICHPKDVIMKEIK